jgi:membrane-associated phospholipid phosphatase
VVKPSSAAAEPEQATADAPRLLTAALALGLLAAALALLVFSWLGREISTGVTPAADQHLREAVRGYVSPWLTQLMIAASRYGGPSWLVPIGLVLAIGFLVKRWYRGAVLVLVTMAGAGLLNTLLKQTFARARPAAFFPDYPLPTSLSFPSGHAFFAASFLGGVAALLSGRIRSTALRAVIWVATVGLILLIGFSRVYLGVHYPSDVFAGYAAAIVWVAAVTLGDRLVSHRRSRRMP